MSTIQDGTRKGAALDFFSSVKVDYARAAMYNTCMDLLMPEESKGESKLDRKAASRLLGRDDTFAFVLMAIAIDKYGEDMADDAEVLMMDLEDDFSCKIPDEGRNRIQAACTAMTTDLFFRNRNVFTAVALALADGDIGSIPSGGDEELDACRCLWAMTEVGLLNGMEFDEVSDAFSDDVVNLVNDVVDNEAEDKEDELEGDDVDTAEEAMAETYYQRFVIANMLEISSQLLELGVDPSVVADMLGRHNRTIADLER